MTNWPFIWSEFILPPMSSVSLPSMSVAFWNGAGVVGFAICWLLLVLLVEHLKWAGKKAEKAALGLRLHMVFFAIGLFFILSHYEKFAPR